MSIPHQIHSHQKFNGVPGPSSPVQPPAVCSQLSLQQQSATVIRRVSNQSFLRLFLCSLEYLSSFESFTSVSGGDNKISVGEVTEDEIKTPFVNWNSYLLFAQGSDSHLQGNSFFSIWVDDWHSLQSNIRDSSIPPFSDTAVSAPGGRPADGPKDSGGNSLSHNLCNETDVDTVESLPFIGPGTVVTAVPCCAPPKTVSLAKALYGHLDIASGSRRFVCARLPRLLQPSKWTSPLL